MTIPRYMVKVAATSVTPSQGASRLIDRRAHPRLVPRSPIVIGAEGGSFTIGDISNGGMFIRTTRSFVVGSHIRVTLQDPYTQAKVPVGCTVRRRVTGADAGIGVEFRATNEQQRAVLDELMKVVAANQPVQAACEELLPPRAPQRWSRVPDALSSLSPFDRESRVPPQ